MKDCNSCIHCNNFIFNKRLKSQRGIAIGPILFVVAILAVLASAISASSGAFNANSTREALGTDAAKIINLIVEMRRATALMLGRGCEYSMLRANTGNLADANCDFFHSQGGNLIAGNYYGLRLESVKSFSGWDNSGFFFRRAFSGQGINNQPELVASFKIGFSSQAQSLCAEINRQLGINLVDGSIPIQTSGGTPLAHSGNINSGNITWDGNLLNFNTSILSGAQSYCISHCNYLTDTGFSDGSACGGHAGFYFVNVLIAQ